MVEPEMSRGGRHRNVRICREARGSRVRLSAACDVSFPLRVGLDGHPLYAAFRAVVTKDRAGGQVFATGSAFETRVIQDRAPTVCPGTKVRVTPRPRRHRRRPDL